MILLKEALGEYSKLHVFHEHDLSSAASAGWKIVAMYEVDVSEFQTKQVQTNGYFQPVTEHAGFRREARFLCVSGSRDEEVERLRAEVQGLFGAAEKRTSEFTALEKKLKEVTAENERQGADLKRDLEHRKSLLADKDRMSARVQKMEADLGKLL